MKKNEEEEVEEEKKKKKKKKKKNAKGPFTSNMLSVSTVSTVRTWGLIVAGWNPAMRAKAAGKANSAHLLVKSSWLSRKVGSAQKPKGAPCLSAVVPLAQSLLPVKTPQASTCAFCLPDALTVPRSTFTACHLRAGPYAGPGGRGRASITCVSSMH